MGFSAFFLPLTLLVALLLTPYLANSFYVPIALDFATIQTRSFLTQPPFFSSSVLYGSPVPRDVQGPSRRAAIRAFAASSLLPLITSSRSASAEVSSGTSLPAGAAQFASLLKSQRDASEVVKSLATSPPSEEGQWKVLSLFIRGLYTAGDDMLYLAKTLAPDKKAKAAEVVEQFKKDVKAADKPVKDQDVKAFEASLRKSLAGIDGFLELLQDVPDEI